MTPEERAARRERTRPLPGQVCGSCGRPANFRCSCGCSAAGCYRCKREGKIG